MDTTCAQNSTLRIPVATGQDSDGFSILRPVAATARKIGGVFAALNVMLGRRTTAVPGMSDRSIARLATDEHLEAVLRWNAVAIQYGGTRIKL